MSTPTNIPETPMGETEQDIFQTILRLNDPDQFDQLCQWMEYRQYRTIDDFYDDYRDDPEKLDIKSPVAEYKWKGKMNHISANVAQKLKSFVKWMTHEKRPHDLHDDYLATLVENSNTRLLLISCSQGILSSSSFSCYLLLRLLVYMYLSQLMRTFTNYLKCIVISS